MNLFQYKLTVASKSSQKLKKWRVKTKYSVPHVELTPLTQSNSMYRNYLKFWLFK